MTNPPGEEQPPQDPSSGSSQDQPGYWEQQAHPGQQDPQQGPAPGQPYPPQGQPYGAPYQPYPPQGYGQPGQPNTYAPDHPKATLVLILGILGLVVCGVVAPFAWRMGKRTVDEIDASQGQLGGRGSAQAGYILGIIGTALLALGLLALAFVVVLTIIGAATSSTTY
jgi:hypothetical protein